MKITGFTIIKNAVIADYPIAEAIRSILPVVDQMIVLIGDCDDQTEQLIRSIPSEKIEIHHSVWDPTLKKGGEVLAVETNKAFDLVPDDATWAFYIQGDEIIHEKYHAAIREAAEKYQQQKEVDGLLFHYLHFYGTYDYVGDSRRWYNKEIRIIRNDKSIRSFRDAQGFRRNGKKIDVKLIDAWVYHYGWVKSPYRMMQKQRQFNQYYDLPADWQNMLQQTEVFDFSDFDSLQKFQGTHPAVMKERIAAQNWKTELDISRKKFSLSDRFLYWYEKKTGHRPFDFKNYRII